MTLGSVLIDLFLAVVMVMLVSFLKRGKENNWLFDILFPSIVMVLACAVMTQLGFHTLVAGSFWMVIFYFFLSYIIERYVSRRSVVFDAASFLGTAFLSIALAFFISTSFIDQVEHILPDPEAFKTELWFLILIYLYIILKDRIPLPKRSEETKKVKSQESIVTEYAKLKHRYATYMNQVEKDPFLKRVGYTIMVYESLYNPYLKRRLVEQQGKWQKKAVPMGIMQVKSKKVLTDEKSIEQAMIRLRSLWEKQVSPKKKVKEDTLLLPLLLEYTKDKTVSQQMYAIYEEIVAFDAN